DVYERQMMDNPLPTGFEAGYDGMEIALD
ncbi:phosphonate metabolism protein PhnP, partial [Klebsiella pneumoniae]